MKLERRAAILQLARQRLEQSSFDEIRLADLAAELGLVKGTLYLYFPTKHELFGSILLEEIGQWWDEARQSLAPNPALAMVDALVARPLLLRLVASLHMTIEPGLTEEGLRSLKTAFLAFAQGASADLDRAHPGLAGRGFGFLLQFWAMAVGTAQLAYPPENVRRLLESEPALAPFRVDCAAMLKHSATALWRGRLEP